MSKLIMLIAPLAVALTTTAPALAHGHHGGGACRQDLQALCPNVTPGPGSFRDCLATLCQATPGPGAFASCVQEAAAANNVTLSDQCQAQLTKMQAKIAAWQTACGNYGPCTGSTGPRALGQCLRDAQTTDPQFPPACAALLTQRHGHGHHHGDHSCGTPTPGSSAE
jgi:hypothetical protein